MFFGLTGMPMRNSVLAKMVLAEADPEPFTVANFTTKSLMPLISELASLQMGSDPALARSVLKLDVVPRGLTPSLPQRR